MEQSILIAVAAASALYAAYLHGWRRGVEYALEDDGEEIEQPA